MTAAKSYVRTFVREMKIFEALETGAPTWFGARGDRVVQVAREDIGRRFWAAMQDLRSAFHRASSGESPSDADGATGPTADLTRQVLAHLRLGDELRALGDLSPGDADRLTAGVAKIWDLANAAHAHARG